MHKKKPILGLLAALGATVVPAAWSSPEDDRRTVAQLDTEFQAAVKRNDAATMQRILHDEMVLVLGDGRTFTKAEIVQAARDRAIEYEKQDEDPGTQVVRVWGDTAVVTARLWIKGVAKAGALERRLWFSDTYVRTAHGWKYAFGQASLKLPEAPATSKVQAADQ
jgi:ketosteroid isomerase-like protein